VVVIVEPHRSTGTILLRDKPQTPTCEALISVPQRNGYVGLVKIRSDMFQDIVLTMFGKHRNGRMDEQAGQKY